MKAKAKWEVVDDCFYLEIGTVKHCLQNRQCSSYKHPGIHQMYCRREQCISTTVLAFVLGKKWSLICTRWSFASGDSNNAIATSEEDEKCYLQRTRRSLAVKQLVTRTEKWLVLLTKSADCGIKWGTVGAMATSKNAVPYWSHRRKVGRYS